MSGESLNIVNYKLYLMHDDVVKLVKLMDTVLPFMLLLLARILMTIEHTNAYLSLCWYVYV